MSVERPTYMLSPNWDILPTADGPLTLGAVMIDPRNPLRELNHGSRPPIDPSEITNISKKHWSFSRTRVRAGHVGLWTGVLAPVLGVGADASLAASRERLRDLTCRELETRYFQPGLAYIAQSLKAPFVAAYVSAHRKPVYMVTGVKVARGASLKASGGGEVKWDLDPTLDGTPSGVPGQLGAKVGSSSTNTTKESFKNGDDFVLAYRLIRITPKKDDGFGEKDYNKWALMDDDEEGDEKQKSEEKVRLNFDLEDVRAGESDQTLDSTRVELLRVEDEDPDEAAYELVLPMVEKDAKEASK